MSLASLSYLQDCGNDQATIVFSVAMLAFAASKLAA